MKRLARALMVAAVAGGVTMTSLAFNGMQGGGAGGGGRGMRGGGGHSMAVVPAHNGFVGHPGFAGHPGFGHPGFGHPGFPGRRVFVTHSGFPFHRAVVVGGPFFFGTPPVVFVSGFPAIWYCQDPIGYFPTIQACPVGWIEMSQY
ncbi:hypothetical protein VAR608DRAFT_6095 [Variovorax sp. HW608]|uniref:hypothetical protein n=1 Tax=Variovorax sp. HW608 TaxID=1034889 RepID=UPI00081FD4B2|nr:hypothetical protein [Variovorax sp. HW608]SCK57628.1 hypothetical protein VAR608DRAFT_6095 [Variovorax sp. HW608]